MFIVENMGNLGKEKKKIKIILGYNFVIVIFFMFLNICNRMFCLKFEIWFIVFEIWGDSKELIEL